MSDIVDPSGQQPPVNEPPMLETPPQRRALMVLGMHRSGTSAMTRVLSLLGASLPKHVMGAGEGNEAGHWEPEKLVALHDVLLAEAGSHWDDWRQIDLSPRAVFRRPETVKRIRAQIDEDYGDASLMLLKDPRISRFAPVYEALFRDMDVAPMAIVVVRNPLAVVRSLLARKAVPINSARYASLMWLRHMIDAERDSRDMPRAVVSYEGLLNDWRQAITAVDQELGLDLPLRDNDIADQIQSFLSDDLSHHDASHEALARSSAVLPMAKRAYAALLLLEKNPKDADARRDLDEIAAALETATQSIGVAVHDELNHRQQQLSSQLNQAQMESHGHYVRSLDLAKEVETLHNAVWQKTAEIGQLTAQAATLATTYADAEKRVADYASRLIDTREKSLQLIETNAQKTAEIDGLRKAISTLESQHGDLMGTVAELTTELSLMRQATNAANAELARIEVVLSARSAELTALRASMEEEKAALLRKEADLRQLLEAQVSELAGALQDITGQRETSRQSEDELRDRAAHSHHMMAHYQKAASDAETAAMLAKVSVFDADHKIRQRDEQINGLAAELARQQTERQALTDRLAALEHSTSWRLMAPVRALAGSVPALAGPTKRAARIGGYLLRGELPQKFALWRHYRRLGRQGATDAVEEASAGEPAGMPSAGLPAAREPLVSVIILNFNKPDLTLFAVQQVLAHAGDIAVETIVIDNGSLYENYEKLAHPFPPEARLVRLHVNRYFGEGNNIGAEYARGRYVVFLNNDAFVTENWLPPLLDVFATMPDVGGVGPKFIYPDGRLQEVGGTVSAEGAVNQIGKTSLPDPAVLTEVRETEYSSAACFMMERRRFFEIGGFDLMYEPAYYEDVDLCLKLRASGQKLYVTPFSTVIHAENATSSDASTKAMQLNTIVEHNRKKFVARWAKWIANPAEPVRKSAVRQIDIAPSPHQPRVAIYTPYNFVPGGGERYLLHTAQVLSAFCNVTLVTEHPYSAIRIREIMRDFSIPPFPFDMVVRSEITQAFDLAVMMSNEALPPFSHMGKRNLYVCQFPFPITDGTVADRRDNLDGVEAIVVYSGFVKACLTESLHKLGLTAPAIHVICPAVEGLSISGKVLPKDGPIRIVSIGRFFAGGHNKRQDALIDATIELVRRGLDVELALVGSVHPEAEHRQRFRELASAAEGYPITFHPDAAPETVEALLAASHIYCHAAGLGVDLGNEPHRCEHFGISVVEGMAAASVPFVVDNGGPASIVADGVTGYHYTSVTDLVIKISSLIKDPARYNRVSAAAHQAALAFDTASFTKRWTELAEQALHRSEP